MAVTYRKKVDLSQLIQERQQLASEISEHLKSITEKNKKMAQIDAQLSSGIKQITKAMKAFSNIGIADENTQVSLWDEHPVSLSNASRVLSKKRKGSMLSDPIREVLRETGRAMTTRELFEELVRRQVKIGGQRPQANLGAHLVNVEGVERQGNAWTLKGNGHAAH